MAIQHKFTLICDEVRREDNGKLIFIGMYPSGVITVPQVPFSTALTFAMFTSVDAPTRVNMKFKVQALESGQTLLDGRVDGQFGAGDPFLPLKVPVMRFIALGSYNFVAEIEGQQDPIIVQFQVRLREAGAARPR